MTDNEKTAQLFSGGKFEEAADQIADNIEWNIYEEKTVIKGKAEVLKFGRSVAEYFKTLTTKFELYGLIANNNSVAVYGRAEFIRKSKTVNTVHSCDIYEFDETGRILKAYSYCNSQPAVEESAS